MISLQTKYRPHPEVIATTLSDNEVVLLHLQTHHYYTLNATGAQIWSRLSSDHSPAQISEELTASYDISFVDACTHVQDLLKNLAAEQLIQPIAAA